MEQKRRFHPEKCQILTISRSRSPIIYDYTLHGQSLSHVSSAKYLGVTLSKDLSWNQHISHTACKGTRSLNFLKRNFRINSPELKSKAYKAIVRPVVEYATTVWDPYTKKNIHTLEMVQRRAACYVPNRHDRFASVTDMISELKWETLEERRTKQRLAMFYKIHHGLVAVDKDKHIKQSSRVSRHSHDQAYEIPKTGPDYYDFSFFPSTINDWNRLPQSVIDSKTIDSFKNAIV